MTAQNQIQFNPKVKLILSDVDETIADVYYKAAPEMIEELEKLLREGKALFLISGGGLQSIRERITDAINPQLRHRIIIAHCMGAEIWGFTKEGGLKEKPYYGIYDSLLTSEQKKLWRQIIADTVEKFHLTLFPVQPTQEFIQLSHKNTLAIMLADRGPQITLEMFNSIQLSFDEKNVLEKELGIDISLFHDSYDLRQPIRDHLNKRYKEEMLPIEARFGGTAALDSIIGGVDKTKAITYILHNKSVLNDLDLNEEDLQTPDTMEIWGDKFGQKKGGPDFDMCRAVDPRVRAIDFRNEDRNEIPTEYNIQIWKGEKELHEGLLEYLELR